MKFFKAEENERLKKEIYNSNTSDKICIPVNQCKILTDLWEKDKYIDNDKHIRIPADIFWCGTIPVLDCIIEIDCRENENIKNDFSSFRVIINKNYNEIIKLGREQGEYSFEVGYFVCDFDDGTESKIINPIYISDYEDYLMCNISFGYININKERIDRLKNIPDRRAIEFLAFKLKIWYGVQIALLHPVIKNIFIFSGVESNHIIKNNSKISKRKKRRVRYVKKIIFNAKELNKILYKNDKSLKKERKTLAWYVIGHWRTYKNGNKIFVKPYWKGPLKELKMNFEDREREIILK